MVSEVFIKGENPLERGFISLLIRTFIYCLKSRICKLSRSYVTQGFIDIYVGNFIAFCLSSLNGLK